ncbi:MAG: 50S ribosomal protein L9 [Acidaminococcaceae bacterium]|nr:50S ribosomal protein L9 [Acidaminococcaceae bacterium]
MKVILLSDVKNLGKKGDIVEAAEGYGRNYLIPRKLAKEATTVNMNQALQDKKVAEHRAAQRKDEAVMLASQIEKVTVKLKLKVGANGKLFGAITSKDVAEALMKQTGLEIDRRKIELGETVKLPGSYTAVAKLHPEISAKFNVLVEADAD